MDKESLAVGWFLAVRQIKRTNPWTTLLIVFVMMLTFLNLVVVSGILIGLVEGSSFAYRTQYSGDVLVSSLATKSFIPNTISIVKNSAATPHIGSYSVRYISGAIVESDYKKVKKPGDNFEKMNASFTGIDPEREDSVTELSKRVVEGEYLSQTDDEYVLVGSSLIKEYAGRSRPGGTFLSNVKPGNKIKLTIKDKEKEYTVKGIIKSKIGEVGNRIYGIDREVRKITERFDYNANEIAFKISDSTSPEQVKADIVAINELDGKRNEVNVQTWEEAQGQFFKDVQATFFILGSLIGLISLAVASITLFIVIFINAFSRRRYIGILKGIGVDAAAIKISYIFQSVFYSTVGSLLGFIIVYAILVPYFYANPIDFPFSDGFLYAPVGETMARFVLLLVVTIIAGYIPAAMITGRNTLDAILGR
jgi:ABC-type lipoprotein release transport system permease subunit